MNIKDIKQNIIYEVISGSHAYGLNTQDSDIDVRGIFIAPEEYILSINKNIEQVEDPESDTVFYELKKFLKLAIENNPNIIELLYADRSDIKFISNEMRIIIDKRDLFLSKKSKHTFCGYAHAQLAKMISHKKWIMNPEKENPPSIEEYCTFIDRDGDKYKLNDTRINSVLLNGTFLAKTFNDYDKQILRVYHHPDFCGDSWFNNDKNDICCIDIDNKILERKNAYYNGILVVNYKAFSDDLKRWKQYWQWKNNRNEQRSLLENKHGYDTKHAMHLMRLMLQCREILSDHRIILKSDYRDFLMAIRNGEYSYDQIIGFAKTIENQIEKLYESSSLRNTADHDAINDLYRSIIKQHIK